MRRWIVYGDRLEEDTADEVYVQVVGNILTTLLTAAMIGAYHLIFHI